MKRPSLFHTLLSLIPKRTSSLTPTNQPTILPPRPSVDDDEAWPAYWKELGQPWRRKPEIDAKRQQELSRCRAIISDIEQGIYPFKGVKLSRADVEWLLATHDGQGPVDWNDENQRKREGLDIYGADLSGVDLHKLPLARLKTGPDEREFSEGQEKKVITYMKGANFNQTQLQGANLSFTQLQHAEFTEAQLENVELFKAQLQGSSFYLAQLEKANLCFAQLQGANLSETQLEKADLSFAQLQGADLSEAQLEKANLRMAALGDQKKIGPKVIDVGWGGVNLGVIEWSRVRILGDEYEARQKVRPNGRKKDREERFDEYQAAVRANSQLSVVLQAQGLNEDAARFAYRAQVLQRKAFWFQMLKPEVKLRQRGQALGAWFFSWFLFLLAGYGYRPGRSFLAYLLVISGFATAYYLLGHAIGPVLSPLGAFVFSMTSFHGRGFFPGGITLDDPLTVIAAIEAFVGLLIEVTFIATLTQRFFGK